jgi:arylsulfatase A-like enzyme
VQPNRRNFLGAMAAGLAVPAAARARRPNIILMMADDMGYSDLGCYGSEIRTPNLDRMASGGIRFTHFHNTARCCPTRASLMTGLYPHQAGMGHMTDDTGLAAYRGEINRKCVTIAEVMRAARYRTLMCGKWHLTFPTPGHEANWPLQRGFDHFFGTIAGAGSYYDPVTLQRDNQPVTPRENFYYTDAIGDQAAAFVSDYAGKPDPFFMYVAFTSPHWPLHALAEDIERYADRYKTGWDELRNERYRRMVDLGIIDRRWKLTPRDPSVPAWADAPNKEWEARRMAVYAAQVDRMDQNVGKIFARLKAAGIERDTLVLFLADNGGCAEVLGTRPSLFTPARTLDGRPLRLGNNPQIMPGGDDTYESYATPWANASNTPFRLYKHWVHEGGTSTPLIASWPGAIRPGGWNREPGHLVDIMATCADVGGASYPKTFAGQAITPREGLSLRPAFEGKRRKLHDAIFWEHEGNRAVLAGNWKLVSRFPGKWELYDLDADRTEMNNLIDGHPEIASRMSAQYDEWARKCGVMPWNEVRAKLPGS